MRDQYQDGWAVYGGEIKRYHMILNIYKGLGVTLEKWRKRAFRFFPQLESPRILDVATGTGRNLPYLVEKYPDYSEILGIDYSKTMMKRAKASVLKHGWENIKLKIMDAREMSSHINGKFDLIISTYSLSIVPEADQVLEEIKSLLKPEGYLILLDCQKFEGPLRVLNPLAILLAMRLGGNWQTYSVPVSDIATKLFRPIRRELLYSGMFYFDIYRQDAV